MQFLLLLPEVPGVDEHGAERRAGSQGGALTAAGSRGWVVWLVGRVQACLSWTRRWTA